MSLSIRRFLYRSFILLTIVFISLLASACVREIPRPPATKENSQSVDPLFAKFYASLGGKDVLGIAISPMFTQNGISYQYTVSSLLAYDPKAAAGQQYRLSSLGKSMGITEPVVIQPQQTEANYLDGHIIFPEFVPLFRQLGGKAFTGAPLTEARYNRDRKRIEQFFENVGFFISTEDQTRAVRLLAYGAWKCDISCRAQAPLNSIIDLPKQAYQAKKNPSTTNPNSQGNVQQPGAAQNNPSVEGQPSCCRLEIPMVSLEQINTSMFETSLSKIGTDFTGYALSDVFQAEDGKFEQIYENVVVSLDPANPDALSLRPLPDRFQIKPGAYEAASDDPVMIFVPVDDGKGYNVPSYFIHYLSLHGGMELAGKPLTSFSVLEDDVFWQCFTNLCLEEDRGAPDGLLIRPVAMGYLYKQAFYKSKQISQKSSTPAKELALQVWEIFPRVASNQEQIIEVGVAENNTPREGVQPDLVLTLPDGKQQQFTFTATDKDGRSQIRLPAIAASNSTLIPYQVCITNQTGEKFCVKESYLIWNNP